MAATQTPERSANLPSMRSPSGVRRFAVRATASRAILTCTVLAVGALLTIAGLVVVRSHSGVYDARVSVVMLAPTPTYVNVLQGDPASLVNFAAIVERDINGSDDQPRAASPDATLYGMGVDQGYSIHLRNNGGQWQSNFNEPIIDVEVVGPTAAWVQSTLTREVQRIQQVATRLQQEQQVAGPSRIRPSVLTPGSVVNYVGGNRSRASLGVLILGIAGSVVGVHLAGLVAGRRPSAAPALDRTSGAVEVPARV